MLCGPSCVCPNYSSLPFYNENCCTQYINEWAWLCSNETLFIKTDDRLHLAHKSQLCQTLIWTLIFQTFFLICVIRAGHFNQSLLVLYPHVLELHFDLFTLFLSITFCTVFWVFSSSRFYSIHTYLWTLLILTMYHFE